MEHWVWGIEEDITYSNLSFPIDVQLRNMRYEILDLKPEKKQYPAKNQNNTQHLQIQSKRQPRTAIATAEPSL